MSFRELNPMSTSIQNVLLDQNISNSLETRDHLQAKWKLERTNEMSAFQKLLPNFGEHPNYMHFYLDHDEIQGREMILNFFLELFHFLKMDQFLIRYGNFVPFSNLSKMS